MKNKAQLDLAVATMLNKKRSEVADVTSLFFMVLMNAIAEDGEAKVDGFGRFTLGVRQGKRATVTKLTQGTFKKGESKGTQLVVVHKKYTVHFKKSAPFRIRLHERYDLQETTPEKEET